MSTAPDAMAAPPPEPLADPLADARAALTEPPERRAGGSLVLLISLVLFAVTAGDGGLAHVVVVVAVILLHELGHLFGMWVFGYKDLRIFFIPFFGGAASGRKAGAAGWQQVIVLFLGPVPGVVLGGVLALINLVVQQPLLGDVAGTMFLINAFNLIPLSPLDGGRIFELALFRRHWLLDAAFSLLCAAGLAGLGVLGVRVLFFVAALQVMALPARIRFRRAVADLARRLGPTPLPADAALLPDETIAVLRAEAERLQPGSGAAVVNARLRMVRALWEELAARPLGALGAVLALGAWGACVLVCLIGGIAHTLLGGAARDGRILAMVDDTSADLVPAQALYDAECRERSPDDARHDIACRRLAASLHQRRGDDTAAQAELEPVATMAIPELAVGLAAALEQLERLEARGHTPAEHRRAHLLRAAEVYDHFASTDEAAAARAAAAKLE